MKLTSDERDAVLRELVKKQKLEKSRQLKKFTETVNQDGKFEELAQIIKTKFLPEFDMFISLSNRALEVPVKELAKTLRNDFTDEKFEPVGIKSKEHLLHEIILKAPKAKTYEEIINAINPFTDEQETE
jgi:hypothetical protein